MSPFLIRKGKKSGVYLTFDDGPHPVNTLKIANALSDAGVRASFFWVGDQIEKHPEIVKEVIQLGHDIGYHSFSHKSLRKMSRQEVAADFAYIRRFEKQFGYRIKYYRPPYGELTLTGLFMAVRYGLKVVMWSLDSRDSYDAEEEVMNNVSPNMVMKGDILLFHDDYDLNAKIMPKLIKEYRQAEVSLCSLESQ